MYIPIKKLEKYPKINRRITVEEYDELVNFAIDLGVENGFTQEGETVSENFIPEYNEEGV